MATSGRKEERPWDLGSLRRRHRAENEESVQIQGNLYVWVVLNKGKIVVDRE